MPVLSVNLNKIAVIRNSRGGKRPSVIEAARTVLEQGCKGITVHPRPDMRHITPADVHELSALLADRPDVEFNIEGNPSAGPTAAGYPGFDALIEAARPAQATLVPDSDDQLTSDHGFALTDFDAGLAEKIARYQSYGARVSLFMDPVQDHIAAAKTHGADRIELYTGPFAEAVWQHGAASDAAAESLAIYRRAAEYASQLGLGVNAGHDLDLENLPVFCRIEHIDEVSIGHALISDALNAGLAATVRQYLEAVNTSA